MASWRCASSSTWSAGTYRISASGSMNFAISQGQAMRSVLGRARVIHFMTAPVRVRWLRGWVVGGQAGQVEVAAGHLVAGDRPVADGLVDLARGERVAVWGGDPRVEDVVAGPHGDHHRFAGAVGGFADEFGEDAVLLADLAAGGDPGQVAVAPFGR